MARLGKRLLSAFIETTEDKKEESPDKGVGAGSECGGG